MTATTVRLHRWDEIDLEKVTEMISRKIVTGDRQMAAQVYLKKGALVLDGPTLAKIFMGEIAQWDDPAIKTLNPALVLPALEIVVVHRSDGSGTTYNFTNYLAKTSPAWKAKIGFEAAVEWPVGVGAKRNEGVARSVARNDGAIGYVEFATALENELVFAAMINQAGKVVAPGMTSFQAAAANADWSSVLGYGLMLTDQPGDGSRPITAASCTAKVHSE